MKIDRLWDLRILVLTQGNLCLPPHLPTPLGKLFPRSSGQNSWYEYALRVAPWQSSQSLDGHQMLLKRNALVEHGLQQQSTWFVWWLIFEEAARSTAESTLFSPPRPWQAPEGRIHGLWQREAPARTGQE